MFTENIISKEIKNSIYLLFFLGIILSILNIVYYDYLEVGIFMIWNLFLAALPLIISIVLVSRKTENRLVNIFLKLAWLFFFPNSPYLITDLIHIKRYKNFFDSSWIFIADFSSWLGLVHLVLVVLVGVLLGYISLYLLQKKIRKTYDTKISWLFVIGVSALTSIGIYLGRFMRFNTWDIILNPISIVKSLFQNVNIPIIIIFFIMTVVPYLIFYFLIDKE